MFDLKTGLRWLVRLLPVAFILFVAGCISFGVRSIADEVPWKTKLTAGSSEKAADAAALKAALDAEDARLKDLGHKADDLRWILGLILGAAGLFAIVQGAAAFFTAQTFVRQADDALKRVQEVAADAQRRYPVFSKAEEARREAYGALAATFSGEGLDWRDELYERMPLLDRQRLISVESFVGIEFVAWEHDADFAENLRRLANFYASKFVSEDKRDRGDLERSEYYLSLARKETNDGFWILNDLGLLYLELNAPRRLAEAQGLFERSHAQNPRQQRASYNLAKVATYEAPPRWRDAAELLERALKEDLWERAVTPGMKGNVYYNLACARARLSEYDRVLEALRAAAEIGQVKKSAVDNDLAATGDLREFAAHPGFEHAFAELRTRLSQHAGESGVNNSGSKKKLPKQDRLSRAWAELWKDR